MSNPAPILNVTGRVHATNDRTVDPVPASPEQRDPETQRITRPAYPARDGYSVVDVTVLTDEGGFATVVFMPDAIKALMGELPSRGDEVEYPCRAYVQWERAGARSYPRVGLSLAGDLYAARKDRAKDRSGSRVASVSSAAS